MIIDGYDHAPLACGSSRRLAEQRDRRSSWWSINRLVAAFHVTRQTLSNLFNGHTAPLADMAIRLEKAFGIKADTLMCMQTAYDMAQALIRADDIVVDKFLVAV